MSKQAMDDIFYNTCFVPTLNVKVTEKLFFPWNIIFGYVKTLSIKFLISNS